MTNQELVSNDAFMEALVQSHQPAPNEETGIPFWIAEKGNKTTTPPEIGTMCICRHETFTKKYPVYFQLGLGGIQTRCESKPSKRVIKNKTSHKKSQKYPHLRVLKKLSRKDNNTGIKVRNATGHLFFLVALGHTKTKTDAAAAAVVAATGKRKRP